MALRHRWDYGLGDSYSAKHRTCVRCKITAKTFGVGAGRIWSFYSPDGEFLGTSAKAIPCEPKEESKS